MSESEYSDFPAENEDEVIPETDWSESDASQASEIDANGDLIVPETTSESESDGEMRSQYPNFADYSSADYNTEVNDSDDFQSYTNNSGTINEIYVSETSSESDEASNSPDVINDENVDVFKMPVASIRNCRATSPGNSRVTSQSNQVDIATENEVVDCNVSTKSICQIPPTSKSNIKKAENEDDERTIIRIPIDTIEISEQSKKYLGKIEDFVTDILDKIVNKVAIEITVQNRQTWLNCFLQNDRFHLHSISDAQCRRIKSTYNLSVIFYMLGEIYELLSTNKITTIRELYYKNVNITQKQENVNEALKTICCLLEVAPWDLGVLTTSKGLIAGPLEIYLSGNVVINCNIDKNGIILPHLTAGIVELKTSAAHILVVEKDTVFRKLIQCDFLERWTDCILKTGKGYPDTNTRLILNNLHEMCSIPIHILTDADPYGIEIMLTYRHGSMSMANLAKSLAVPSIRWLGILPSDIRRFGIQTVSLTREDRRKLNNLLKRPFTSDHVHNELLIMEQNNLKAEIEGIFDSSCAYLIDVYLRNKIDNVEAI